MFGGISLYIYLIFSRLLKYINPSFDGAKTRADHPAVTSARLSHPESGGPSIASSGRCVVAIFFVFLA